MINGPLEAIYWLLIKPIPSHYTEWLWSTFLDIYFINYFVVLSMVAPGEHRRFSNSGKRLFYFPTIIVAIIAKMVGSNTVFPQHYDKTRTSFITLLFKLHIHGIKSSHIGKFFLTMFVPDTTLTYEDHCEKNNCSIL